MEIGHDFNFVNGAFDTKQGELVAVQKNKYKEVHLCFKANMNIPFAKIKLHSADRFESADKVMNDAYQLATEIARRFNEFPKEKKL
ncbi:hypothetical protein [Christiangramia sp.]|uniref:hypothetical protein n=1 Tax=Christiangramia sp. TaxID=1931228 RepID=UPI00261C7DCF|nr:hypothetical protein [Christiangramia sp.]